MAARTVTILALIALVSMASASCYNRCRFRFCNGNSVVRLGSADKALSGPICRSGQYIGVLNSGEARVRTGGYHRFTRISKYNPLGLKQNFSNHFFKTYTIKYTKHSGVGHEVPQANQLRFLNRRCVILPITAYQVLASGKVVKNVHPYSPKRECIAFSTRVY